MLASRAGVALRLIPRQHCAYQTEDVEFLNEKIGSGGAGQVCAQPLSALYFADPHRTHRCTKAESAAWRLLSRKRA